MNAIILYGSRYGASQTYAQALEARTGIPAVAYQEIQDFGPFDTIVYIGGLYAGKTTGLAKTVRHFPTDHPFRLLVATVGLSDPAVEDNLLRKFPEQIDAAKNMIAGLETDIQTLAAHPHPEDGFAGMEVKGDNLTDKDNAGAALLETCKEVKDLEPVPVGSYRGFQMALTLENFGRDYILTLKGQMSYRVELGRDARGNLVRIDNALNAMPERVTSQKAYLDNLYAQVKEAKAALGKPFPQEEELRVKSARLAELNAELNIDDNTPMERLAGDSDAVAKSTRPSILQKLRAPLPEQSSPKPKHKEMEVQL